MGQGVEQRVGQGVGQSGGYDLGQHMLTHTQPQLLNKLLLKMGIKSNRPLPYKDRFKAHIASPI